MRYLCRFTVAHLNPPITPHESSSTFYGFWLNIYSSINSPFTWVNFITDSFTAEETWEKRKTQPWFQYWWFSCHAVINYVQKYILWIKWWFQLSFARSFAFSADHIMFYIYICSVTSLRRPRHLYITVHALYVWALQRTRHRFIIGSCHYQFSCLRLRCSLVIKKHDITTHCNNLRCCFLMSHQN